MGALAAVLALGLCAASPVKELPLHGPAAYPASEISGMAWHGDHLFLVAENPTRGFFVLDKAVLLAAVDADDPDPLEPGIALIENAEALEAIPNFDGIEALTFHADEAYMLVESRSSDCAMAAYLIRGKVDPATLAITLDKAAPTALPLSHQTCNFSCEALVLHGESLLVFEEANGANLVPAPKATVFSLALEPQAPLPIPSIEYRVTDATPPDAQGKFWAINYLWPPERKLLDPADAATDPKAPVELLLELQVNEDGVRRTERAPVDLRAGGPASLEPHNWEGIARLGNRGFLLITDAFPRTVLRFVSLP
jgi:hypothetical protein